MAENHFLNTLPWYDIVLSTSNTRCGEMFKAVFDEMEKLKVQPSNYITTDSEQ